MKAKKYNNARSSGGFTLIELLAVIAVIGVLSAILIPAVSSARQKSASAKAISNARQVGMANMLYSQENRGEILGQDDTWAGTMRLYRNLTRYLANTANPSEEDVVSTLAGIVDPSVSETYLNYGQTYPYTWSINRIFNMNWGRVLQGIETPQDRNARPRRMAEFEDPANTVYAVSGGFEITPTSAANDRLLGEPEGRQPIFYLYGNNDQTPAVFLDGHAELLTYPIDPRKINPSLDR